MNTLPDAPNGWGQYNRLLKDLSPVMPPSGLEGRIAHAVESGRSKPKGIGVSWKAASGMVAVLAAILLCFFYFSPSDNDAVAPVKGKATVERAAKKSARSSRSTLPTDTHSPMEVPALQIPNPPDNLGYPTDTFTVPPPAPRHQPTTGPGRVR